MTLEEQLEALRVKGFAKDQAEVIVVMREAAIVIFSVFPDSFILIGGASLVLFEGSVRHSADLDLFPREELPTAGQFIAELSKGLKPLAGLMNIQELRIDNLDPEDDFVKLAVSGDDRKRLFTIDLTRISPVIEAETVEHSLESVSQDTVAQIRTLSSNNQLLQKAEAFMFRPKVKARDAYDIFALMENGASLTGHLKAHLEDALYAREIAGDQIRERMNSLETRHFQAELEGFLPERIYTPLAKEEFKLLKAALEHLFADYR